MAIKLGQSLKQSQSLTMTPQLQQAIKLLQMSRLELETLVREEMLENPVLEDQHETGETTDRDGTVNGDDRVEISTIDKQVAQDDKVKGEVGQETEKKADDRFESTTTSLKLKSLLKHRVERLRRLLFFSSQIPLVALLPLCFI